MGKQLAHCERCGDEKQKAVMAFICGADHDYWECDSCADQREFESTALRDPAYICEYCFLYDADRVKDGVCDNKRCQKTAEDYTLVACKCCLNEVPRIETTNNRCNECEERIHKHLPCVRCDQLFSTTLYCGNCSMGCKCICVHEPELTV